MDTAMSAFITLVSAVSVFGGLIFILVLLAAILASVAINHVENRRDK